MKIASLFFWIVGFYIIGSSSICVQQYDTGFGLLIFLFGLTVVGVSLVMQELRIREILIDDIG